MKILVVSLLRLGDIIQQEPLLRGLREKHPNAEIHLLLNKQFSSIERLLSGLVDRFVCFDRESLQQGLGEASYNILWSFTQLESLTTELNSQEYDLVLNFTHNKLSAYLIGAIRAKNKLGLHQADGRFQGLENRWLRYFNERFSGTQKSLFHYVELLGKSFAIPYISEPVRLKSKTKTILFQCLTSDKKKNWGLERFLQLKRTIEESLVDYKVLILGASFEREQLAQVFEEDSLLICDLSEAQQHLSTAALLVAGDTSIKHLAAQAGIPIVEITLGSSDATKTSAFTSNKKTLESAAPCAPCSHSGDCFQKSHLCAENVAVESVFAAVWDLLVAEPRTEVSRLRDFERAVWSLYLDKEHADVEPFYAESARGLSREVKDISQVLLEAHKGGEALSSWLLRARRALPSREALINRKTLQSGDLAELILIGQEILRSKQDEYGYFQAFMEALTSRFSHPVQMHDRILAALSEIQEIIEIRSNLIRYLENISKEGGYYATGIGKLSIGGFEEVGASVQRADESSDLQRRNREFETLG